MTWHVWNNLNYHATGHVVMWSVTYACDHIIIWNNELLLPNYHATGYVNGHVISHMDMLSYYYMKQWYSVIRLVVLICDMTYFDTIPNYHATGHVVMWMVMWSVKWACDHIIIWNNDLVSSSWSFWYATWHVLKQF